MSYTNQFVETLYNLSLNSICDNMNEEALQHVLKFSPPSIVLEIVWKILRVNDEMKDLVIGYSVLDFFVPSVTRGTRLLEKYLYQTGCMTNVFFYGKMNLEVDEAFESSQQIDFVDEHNFCNHFTLDLFFKLVEITNCRSQLFIIFKICVKIKGFEFPKKFAEDWMNSINGMAQDYKSVFRNIEQGLKLGIFLGDSGWLNESALVLSFTYDIISTKWVCLDQNLELTTILQCLTKWLLVVSNYHNFDEAKVVLQHILCSINIIENIEGRTLCIAYAYVAVSQYYYVSMEFKTSWSWAVKAVYELHEESGDILKLSVLSHAIRVCSVLYELNIAKKLKEQLYTYKKEMDQNVYVDMLLNEACYSLKADLTQDSLYSYKAALYSRHNLFGYFNLNTAIVFVDYAYARYVCNYPTKDFDEAMRSILHGIFIMKRIGIPNDNMMLVNAERIKALIIEENAVDLAEQVTDVKANRLGRLSFYDQVIDSSLEVMETIKNEMLSDAEALHLKALDVSLKAVGENTLLAAKSYCNLGRLYQSQEKYSESEKMHLKAIEIKESILGKDNPDVALCLGHLASLYTYRLKKYKEAEVLYLRSKTIYETTYGQQYSGLLYDYQGLREVYRELNEMNKHDEYANHVLRLHDTTTRRQNKNEMLRMHTTFNSNCTKDDFSLEKFKCILNECLCEKYPI